MSLAAASGGLTQATISGLVQIYKRDETYNTNEIANAILACLVAVTGCCPFIGNGFAVLIGGLLLLLFVIVIIIVCLPLDNYIVPLRLLSFIVHYNSINKLFMILHVHIIKYYY